MCVRALVVHYRQLCGSEPRQGGEEPVYLGRDEMRREKEEEKKEKAVARGCVEWQFGELQPGEGERVRSRLLARSPSLTLFLSNAALAPRHTR